jgi:monoamine oxidase
VSGFDRRDFLRHLLTAAGLTVAPLDRLPFGQWEIASAQQPRRIIIVGAGLAGLAAAYELVKTGHEVIVLEAQSRPGGRVYTLRDPFSDGLYAEAGAARIPDAHDLTRGYATDFGLQLVPFQPNQAPETRPNQKQQDLGPSAQPGGALGSAVWSDDSLVGSFDKSEAGSPIQSFDKIDGGNDRLAAAFAARLGNRIRYAAPLVRIEQDERGVRAVVQGVRGTEVVPGDLLICAIPFTVLRGIHVSPAFSSAKRQAIEQLNYSAATRIFLQSATRYWVKSGKSGFALIDQMQIFDATFGQPGKRGIMMLYTLADLARRLERMKPDQRMQYGLAEAERVYPGMNSNFESGISWCWGEAPWARAAFAVYLPGQMTTLYPIAVQPEGRIYFAGEHLSSWPGWMQGALASGLRAAREVSTRT